VLRQDKELKAIAKVQFESGERKMVTLPIERDAPTCYDTLAREWVAQTGAFKELVGASSGDIRPLRRSR
jgi:beta-glucosidase